MDRFTATVVLPTPPFPLATATRCFTPAIGVFSCCGGLEPGGPGGVGGILFLSVDLNPSILSLHWNHRLRFAVRQPASFCYRPILRGVQERPQKTQGRGWRLSLELL